MDHSGLDRELINSPSACWDSRQGELSASSVSGRARGESLQTDCMEGGSSRGRGIRACLRGALHPPRLRRKSSPTSHEIKTAATNIYYDWIVNDELSG